MLLVLSSRSGVPIGGVKGVGILEGGMESTERASPSRWV